MRHTITLSFVPAEGFIAPSKWDWTHLLENLADDVRVEGANNESINALVSLRAEAETLHERLRAQGGRGVELAEEIDDLERQIANLEAGRDAEDDGDEEQDDNADEADKGSTVQKFIDRIYTPWKNDHRYHTVPRRFALVSPQGTACTETCLCSACYGEHRAGVEADIDKGITSYPVGNAPMRDSWVDVTDNDACWCVVCNRRHNEGFDGFTEEERALNAKYAGLRFEFASPFEDHPGFETNDPGEIIGLTLEQDGLEEEQQRDLWLARNLRTGEEHTLWGGEAFIPGTDVPAIPEHRFTSWGRTLGHGHPFVCPNTVLENQPSPGHVDGPRLDTCGFNEDRYEILSRHEDDSPHLVACRICGEQIENT